MDLYLVAYYIGIIIVFGSHIAMITNPAFHNNRSMQMHAYVNIFAAVLIALWFMKSQKYI